MATRNRSGRQVFQKGQRVAVKQWGNQWVEATVEDPESRAGDKGGTGGYFRKDPMVAVKFDGGGLSHVLNRRSHIMSVEDFEPIRQERAKAKADSERRDEIARRRRAKRFEYHAVKILELGRDDLGLVSTPTARVSAYLQDAFDEMWSTEKFRFADHYAEQEVPWPEDLPLPSMGRRG